MFEHALNHAFRRTLCMSKCSDEQLDYEVSIISEKLSHHVNSCEDARPTYSRSIASLATH